MAPPWKNNESVALAVGSSRFSHLSLQHSHSSPRVSWSRSSKWKNEKGVERKSVSALLRGAEKTGREQPIIPPTRYLTLDKRSVMAASNFRGKLDSCVDVSLLLPHFGFGFGGKMDNGDDRPLSLSPSLMVAI